MTHVEMAMTWRNLRAPLYSRWIRFKGVENGGDLRRGITPPEMQMDIQARFGGVTSRRFWITKDSTSSYPQSTVRIFSARKDEYGGEPPEKGESKGDKFSTDWDKAWSSFKKQGKKSFFKQFSPDKYVTWNPRQSDFPLSEEVDPIKRTERSNLRLWTGPEFTIGGAIVIVTFLLVYSILALAPK